MSETMEWVLPFERCARGDVARVGGKNASLGEMFTALAPYGISVPDGFATTADAYWRFIDANGLRELIAETMRAHDAREISLADAGQRLRSAVEQASWPAELADAIRDAYGVLSATRGRDSVDVAVRSSATAEDLPDASFAGQQETYLNITGVDALLDACRKCYASLFTDRAISYRRMKGFDHLKVALSVGVQIMVRSDRGGSGVMFSLDTETGFDKVVVINGARGLGETVVQGIVDPDEYVVYKPLMGRDGIRPIVEKRCGQKAIKMIYAENGDAATVIVDCTAEESAAFVLDDAEVMTLAEWAMTIEQHYGCPMDMEWALDGQDGSLAIVQARPETVQSRRDASVFRSYTIRKAGEVLARGLSVGEAVVTGNICRIDNPAERDRFVDGSILVTGTTDPDWVPVMKRAAGVITDHGGRTSHAAIVSRELGLPAIVGTLTGTRDLPEGELVTLSCAGGDEGLVYRGEAEIDVEDIHPRDLPDTRTHVMLNLADPGAAFHWWRIPADGVGLARMEFVINHHIRVHPMALVHYERISDPAVRAEIDTLTRGYTDRGEFFVDRLSRGLARIAALMYPRPVIVRLSDFKTNEYANLIGGTDFEPVEPNPMIGFRGASRYYSPAYREGFALECRAIRRLREELGFDNVVVMVPFCRTVGEADRVLGEMAAHGLERGRAGLQVYVMCEIPSNVILAERFAERFDGFSIGSNDLTQLTLGIDRDSAELASLFSEQDEAVKWMIRTVIDKASRTGHHVGLCGQAPSNHPEFARFLVEAGIDAISVTPDSFVSVKQHVAAAEATIES